jgi:hypothetical protein
MTVPLRIAMWSGPRNLSTALMRSFGSRADTAVCDEPFYGAYLKATGDPQPMAADVIASMDCDWHSVAATLCGPVPGGRPIWYQKHMAHHMEGPVGLAALGALSHAFLIRDPRRVVASYAAKRTRVRPDHLGVGRQRAWFDEIMARTGTPPPVVDSADILADPAGTLGALCGALGIAFDPAMLAWAPGRRATDGIWAAHWYGAVEASTGFGPPEGPLPALGAEAAEVAAACEEDYRHLHRMRLRPAGLPAG